VFCRNLQKELRRICQEVAVSIQDGNPTIEIRSAMIMATTWLGVIETRIRKTRNLEERRKLIHEFQRRKQTIERAIEKITSAGQRNKHPADKEHRRALP
jgi:hypothetical protein